MVRGIVILICAVCFYGADSTKTWIGKSNISHVQFWNSVVNVGNITFNASMNKPLAVPRTTEYLDDSCEFVYPLDMDDDDADLKFSTIHDHCLDRGEIEEMERIHWLNPRNWKTSDLTIATPHSEIIPCSSDSVQISNASDTVIILPPYPITLRSLRFGYRPFTMREFRTASQTDWFTNHFVVKSAQNLTAMFNLTGAPCRERTGCVCGNSRYLDDICAFVEKTCNKQLPCEDPIKPVGYCCHICASALTVIFQQERFVYLKLNEMMSKYIEAENGKLQWNIVWYMSKISNTVVQITLMPAEEYTEEIVDVAEALKIFLERKSSLAIAYCGTGHSGRLVGHKLATFFTIVIILAGVLLGGVFVVCLSKFKFLWSPLTRFQFDPTKFKNAADDLKYKRRADAGDASTESSRNESPQETGTVSKSDSGDGFSLIDTFG